MALHTQMALMHLRASLPPTRILLAHVVLSVRRRRTPVSRHVLVVRHVSHVRAWRRGPVGIPCVRILAFDHFLQALGATDVEEQRGADDQESHGADDDASDYAAREVGAAA